MSPVERFTRAQDSADAGFESALEEIRTGRKRSHWIWYIFPQLAGLGTSSLSQQFAIDGQAEAIEFLRDTDLRSRLLTMTTAVAEQLRTGRPLQALMGSDIDAQKLVSSLTLFAHIARALRDEDGLDDYALLARVADEVLQVAASQGYPRCAFTMRQLQPSK
jgi:uncharacterized protein (DUF1810 family)